MSENPKARNSEKASNPEQKEEEVDMKRMLNVGKDVTLSFGDYTVRELDIFSLISIVSEGLEAFVSLSTDPNATELDIIRSIGKDKKFQKQVSDIFALFCGEDDTKQFETLKIKDFCTLVKAIKEVVDFEEIKETFFELGLQKYLNLTPNSTEPETTQASPTL